MARLPRILLMMFVLGWSTGALQGCAGNCVAAGCYPSHRQASLRAANNAGAATGDFLGGGSSRSAMRRLRPGQAIEPIYSFWLDRWIDSLLGF
ncbi:MAG: hypothetical protein KDD69_14480 [Bdellovibrionales bacterium]|nr:hypothetical protein [Bdellovibrionales bacterium]